MQRKIIVVGQQFSLRYEDGSTREFILGGARECDSSGKIPTISCVSPLGTAVRGKKIWDMETIHVKGQEPYDVTVVRIGKPKEVRAKTKRVA